MLEILRSKKKNDAVCLLSLCLDHHGSLLLFHRHCHDEPVPVLCCEEPRMERYMGDVIGPFENHHVKVT